MIQVKKLMFLRTIMNLDENAICKRVLLAKTQSYIADRDAGRRNASNSPIYDILNVAHSVKVYLTYV